MADNGLVKKETMLLVALACLVTGFLAGIVFSVYKGPAVLPQANVGGQQQGGGAAQGQAGGLSPQQASQILSLEQNVSRNPQDADSWVQLGNIWFDTGNVEKAIPAYNKYLEIRPDDPNVLTDLGVMYRRAGQYEQALAVFDKAIAGSPGHQQARFNKGIVLLFDKKDSAAGIAAWEELVKVNPNATAPDGRPLKDVIAEYRAKAGL